MIPRNPRGLVLSTGLLLIVFWAVISSTRNIDAETNITPTLIVTDLNFLPYIRGLQQGPTATSTLPPPTMTPWATITDTPTATATETSTPTPTPTNTVPSPILAAPTLYDIHNDDQDGNFAVAWSAVTGAEFYQVMQNHDDAGWAEIYKGPELNIDRTNLAPGTYCYNVRARGSDQWSDWAGEKCTAVAGPPEYLCTFETIFAGPRAGSDIELLHDGRVFITQTSAESASVFDPQTRSFTPVNLPQGGGKYAAVLADGSVLLTVEGSDPHSMIFDPISGAVTRLDMIYNCLQEYGYGAPNQLVTYCGDNHGYAYGYINNEYSWVEAYNIDITTGRSLDNYIISQGDFRGWHYFEITNGIAAYYLEFNAGGDSLYTNKGVDHIIGSPLPYKPASALSVDKGKIYYSGGGDPGIGFYKDAYLSDLHEDTFEPIAGMRTVRTGHQMIMFVDKNVLVLGGASGLGPDGRPYVLLSEIELYDPTQGKWYKAGTLNVKRYGHKALQLLNGEIFVFGGETEPGPGYSFDAPTEIGRCEPK